MPGVARGANVCLVLLVAASAVVAPAAAAEYFVSTAAQVGGNGSVASPFNTLGEAQTAVRAALRAGPLTDHLIVRLGVGTYHLGEALHFTSADSGRDGYHVIWVGAGTRSTGTTGPEQSIISGGRRVTGWHEGTEPGILEAPLPVEITAPPRQLYVDGLRASRTSDLPNSTRAGLSTAETIITSSGLHTQSTAPLLWPYPDAVELRRDGKYEQSRCMVRAVTPGPGNGSSIEVAQPCWQLGMAVGQMAQPSAVLNIGTDLQPGEFGHKSTKLSSTTYRTQSSSLTLRYRPRDATERQGMLSGDITSIVPVASELIVADGVTAFTLEGITFEHSAWDAPASDDGYLERYGGVRYLQCNASAAKDTNRCYSGQDEACGAGCCGAAAAFGGCALRMAEAAVSIRQGRDVVVEGCIFRQLGAWGLSLTNGPVGTRVSHNKFYDTAGGGVYVGNVNETASTSARKPTLVEITDNELEWTGQEYQGSSGIHLFSAVDSTIAHNRLAHIPYTAITFVWPVPQGDSFNRNLSMVSNDVADPSYWGGDGGAVHTLSECRGCSLRGNYFHDQRHGSKCTYIDNGSSGYTIKDHVIDNASVSIWIYFQQGCSPTCPWAPTSRFGVLPGVNNYPGCNSSAFHEKCCCNVGKDNHAGPGLFVRDGTPNPFPIWNMTGKPIWLKSDQPFPVDAMRIIDAAGPRASTRGLRQQAQQVQRLPNAGREVALFVCCDIAAGEWGKYIVDIQAHRENLTTVIISPYEMTKSAALVPQGAQSSAGLESATKLRAMGLRVTGLVACNPSGVRAAIYNEELATSFINQALAAAAETGLDGFNLDAEFPNDVNHTDGDKFVTFLNNFADALHATNRTLSVDVHGDGSTPFDFHVWGPEYARSHVDRIITMATYTDAKRNFDKYFAEATATVGAEKLQPGMEPNAVLSNPLDIGYIRSKNVSSIAVWGPNPAALAQVHWDMMGAFLTAAW